VKAIRVRRARVDVLALAVGLLVSGGRLPAQPPAAVAPATVTRADLAAAYLRMDKAYAAATVTLDDSTRALINRRFDRSTLSFFVGRFAAAIAAIDSGTVALTGQPIGPPPPPSSRVVSGRIASMWRDGYLKRLAKLDTTGPLAQAFVSARARASLLVDEPSRENSAEFRSDATVLARDLAREVGVLERERNPYVGQTWDAWRVFRGANGTLIPFRIVAPSAAATSGAPVPVIIALHGAGGDENMFVDAYGDGVLAKMAMAANAILVTPATVPFMTTPEHFDSLMSVLRSEYRVNNARIYVIGHSMGAGAAARLAQLRPSQVTAVVCLAGGSAVTVAKAPPMLFIGAALDPIAPVATLKAAAKASPTATYEQLENEGHTLMVGNGVRRAVPWLLAHRP
jgi:predicted esterase